MKKASTVLLWISLGLNVLYLILAITSTVLAGKFNAIEEADGLTYVLTVALYLIVAGIPLVTQLILTIIIIFGFKSHSENIVTEIIMLILYSGLFSLVPSLISTAINIFMSEIGTKQLAVYAQMVSSTVWVSFIGSVGNTLLLLGVAFAIAYKKVEMVDIRRLPQEDEYDWK